MRHMIAGLMLGLASLASTAVHADDTFGTTGLELTVDSWFGQATLLSNANGTLRLNLSGMDATYGIPTTVTSGEGGAWWDQWATYQDHATAWLEMDLDEGYRITSITLSGTVSGRAEPGIPPANVPPDNASEGVARNTFQIGLMAGGTDIAAQAWDSVPGTRAISLASSAIYDTDFRLGLTSSFDLYAESGSIAWRSGDLEGVDLISSVASLSVSDLVLTVQVSAVPEPSSWAMLAAGAGLLAFAARKRDKA